MELSKEARELKRQYESEYREKNRERLREYNRLWREKNKEKEKARQEKYWNKKAKELLETK